jgi:hypothetical protein
LSTMCDENDLFKMSLLMYGSVALSNNAIDRINDDNRMAVTSSRPNWHSRPVSPLRTGASPRWFPDIETTVRSLRARLLVCRSGRWPCIFCHLLHLCSCRCYGMLDRGRIRAAGLGSPFHLLAARAARMSPAASAFERLAGKQPIFLQGRRRKDRS